MDWWGLSEKEKEEILERAKKFITEVFHVDLDKLPDEEYSNLKEVVSNYLCVYNQFVVKIVKIIEDDDEEFFIATEGGYIIKDDDEEFFIERGEDQIVEEIIRELWRLFSPKSTANIYQQEG